MSDEAPEFELSLSKNRKLSVRKFKKMKLIDIREFYSKDGEMFPSKKGISLTAEQFSTLIEHLPEIKKAANIEDKDAEEGGKAESPKPSLKRAHSEVDPDIARGNGATTQQLKTDEPSGTEVNADPPRLNHNKVKQEEQDE